MEEIKLPPERIALGHGMAGLSREALEDLLAKARESGDILTLSGVMRESIRRAELYRAHLGYHERVAGDASKAIAELEGGEDGERS